MRNNVHAGHRKRVRKRFLEEGPDSFADHELLELLLFGCVPQGNTNVIAHELLNEYGSLANVIAANPKDLQLKKGVGEGGAVYLSAQNELYRRCTMDKIEKKPVFTSSEAAGEYCIQLLSFVPNERYYVLCLDSGNRLIHAARVAEGTVNQVVVQPRKVVEAALRNKAVSVILAHNHPGGTKHPSQQDLESTTAIVKALSALEISVSDHFIVTINEYFSFSEHGMI